jgi:hypothetical protein
MTRRICFIGVILMCLVLVLPTAMRTLRLADSPNGLTTIALLDPGEWSLNPFSVNGIFLPPGAARWLLLNTDIPYRPCEPPSLGCEVTLVAWVGRAMAHAPSEKREQATELLHHFIARGESVNQLSQGLTPLHEAVLFQDARYLEILLTAGADVRTKAESSAKSASGLTPIEFCLKLEEKRASERGALCQRLKDI